MAIINNIIFEKASGSVDNLTYYQLNGQQIVRSRNRNPYDPNTTDQLLQRAKMSNAVFCYRYLKSWLVPIKAMVIGSRSVYNQYTSMFTELFPSTRYTSLSVLLNYLASLSIGNSNYCIVTGFNLVDQTLTVNFTVEGSALYSDTKVYVVSTNSATNVIYLSIVPVVNSDWNSGSVNVLLPAGFTDTIGVNINSLSNNKCSNLKF